jgi:predicted DCC family thiol-disulfide oxidoreductase YuxK
MQLTLFYDGFCPLCVAEMTRLQRLDVKQKLCFVDIQSPDFAERYPHLDYERVNARIYGQLDNGELITGLDVTYLAWKLVGKGWVYAPLRWPVIRWFADAVYVFFARYRYQISFVLTGKKRCQLCQRDASGQNNVCASSVPKQSAKSKKTKTTTVCASSAASDL